QLRDQAPAGVRKDSRSSDRSLVPRGCRTRAARQRIVTAQTHQQAELWPFEEARRLVERVRDYPSDRPVNFGSGFGPSGLPHIGTMCEVLRPSYVRHALALLEPTRRTRLVVFIDDMDGLRKVPDNVPNREAVGFDIGNPV